MHPVVAVVIPAYRVRRHVLEVIAGIGPEVAQIYVVDDHCPEGSGELVTQSCTDPRVVVIKHEQNQGVGGAVMTGYRAAMDAGAEVIVKVDGDGQMDPALILNFIRPILEGEADFTKGNRFYDLERIRRMPAIRLWGNAALSFMNKISSGYWNIFDPTNGYIAIHRDVARLLPLAKISKRYFFETDVLFRLSTLRAVVVDVPMDAKYGDETSSLKATTVLPEFFFKHVRNFGKRVFYNYYLRDMSLASVELPLGLLLLLFGVIFGSAKWAQSIHTGVPASSGAVMLAALPVLTGMQLVLAFLAYDIQSVPTRPFHRKRNNALTRVIQRRDSNA
jgi:dolichol-phosphate mannosyltransferase